MDEQTHIGITYKKTDQLPLFESACEHAGFTAAQNYTPLIDRLFSLSGNNCNRVVLSYSESVDEIVAKKTDNVFTCKVDEGHGRSSQKDIFFKYSPLQDPLEYLLKEGAQESLPYFGEKKEPLPKGARPSNAAYTDGFFTYLTTWLANSYYFPNSTVCYGSFVGIKKAFLYNLEDDYDSVAGSEYFIRNVDNKYSAGENSLCSAFSDLSLSNKTRLQISTECGTVPDSVDEGDSAQNQPCSDAEELVLVYSGPDCPLQDEPSSVCSSRSSRTSSDEPLGSEDDLSDDDSLMGDCVTVSIKDFPVHAIALEKLENTLDSLLIREKHPMGGSELSAALLQVVLSLTAYQKCFMLTHNDLHTSNIMYARTERTHLLYKVDGTYFKVPTFGKIWKVIDFGRAIYWANGKLFYSDSYLPDGDAATQYNFADFHNEAKTKVVPNRVLTYAGWDAPSLTSW